METNLQQNRQNEQAATGAQAALPYRIDSPVTVPTFYQTNHAANWLKDNPQIVPPEEGEIHQKMWESSMMMGLMAALATGNVKGGIAGGMWAAIAVHDHGYALRQRAEYVDQLKADGHTFPSILKWYESGDQSELDKERQNMLDRDKFENEKNEFVATEQDKKDDREQAMKIANMRERGINARMSTKTAAMQDFEYAKSLSPEDRKTFLALKGVATDGKGDVGSNPSTTLMNKNLSVLESATDDDIGAITSAWRGGSRGELPVGADIATGMRGGSAREVYNAAAITQGQMQNQGIQAAKTMGASGINTVSEAKMYFKSMPQLDFSSTEAFKASVKDIREYTEGYNSAHGETVTPQVSASAQAELDKQYGIE